MTDPRDAVPPRPDAPPVPPVPDTATLPGVHRGGFDRLPTAPVETAPALGPAPGPDPSPWPEPAAEAPSGGLAGVALAFGILGLAASFFVGWGIPVGLAAIVMAVVAVRRPVESRVIAGWALALGILSVVYSSGWLVWAAAQSG